MGSFIEKRGHFSLEGRVALSRVAPILSVFKDCLWLLVGLHTLLLFCVLVCGILKERERGEGISSSVVVSTFVLLLVGT